MLRTLVCRYAVALVLGALAHSGAEGNSREPGVIPVNDREAFVLAPPDVVAAWDVREAEWSPDGRYVLAARTFLKGLPTPKEQSRPIHSLVLWDGEERKSTELWKAATNSGRPADFGWLRSGAVAFALVHYGPTPAADGPPKPPRDWLVRIDAAKSRLRTLAEVPQGTHLLVSPREPLAVLFDRPTRSLRVLRADGTFGRQAVLPPRLEVSEPGWNEAGELFFSAVILGEPDRARKETLVVFDLRSGQLALRARPDPAPAPPAATEGERARLRLVPGTASVRQGMTSQSIKPLWLEYGPAGGETRLLVCANAEWGKLSPRGDAVLYRSGGAAWVAPLVRFSREELMQARAAASREVAVTQGRQVGLALHIWASDHDDRLPGPDEPVADLLRPILKNDQLLEGFVYTYPGGKLSEIRSPSETSIGYVLGPGGRAEIMADGRVIWKAD